MTRYVNMAKSGRVAAHRPRQRPERPAQIQPLPAKRRRRGGKKGPARSAGPSGFRSR